MDARDLLAMLAIAGVNVEADGDKLVSWPASRMTNDMREALRAAKPEVLVALAEQTDAFNPHWTRGKASLSLDRYARLIRWGWAEPQAGKMAELLAQRDREQDDRVSCADCLHYKPGRCGNYRRAGLFAPQLGQDFASLLQHCPGFKVVWLASASKCAPESAPCAFRGIQQTTAPTS